MKLLIAFTILTYFNFAQAIDSSNKELMMDPAKIPSFSCSVEVVDAENLQHFGTCSGSLISPNTVLTAHHCKWIVEMFRANGRPIAYRVNCGAEERITDRVTLYDGPNEQNQPSPIGAKLNGSYDNMIVKLQENLLNAKPVLLPSTAQEAVAIIENSRKCFASGFGFDKDMTSKEHRGSQVVPGPGQPGKSEFSLGESVFVRSGDSGGGAYCQNSAGSFVLIGLLRDGPMDPSKPGSANFVVAPVLEWIRKNLD